MVLRDVLHAAGGLTATPGRGYWNNPATGETEAEGVVEYTAWYSEDAKTMADVAGTVAKVVATLHALGEAAVMVQWSKYGRKIAHIYNAGE